MMTTQNSLTNSSTCKRSIIVDIVLIKNNTRIEDDRLSSFVRVSENSIANCQTYFNCSLFFKNMLKVVFSFP